MNKKGQMAFSPSDFSQSSQTQEIEKPNMLLRIIQGIVAAVFLFIFAPILVGFSDTMQPSICTSPLVCLFFKFIVPAVILGGIFGIIKFIWGKGE